MNQNGNKQMLESYKVFPFIAWALTFGFALFVYNITTELKEVVANLEERTTDLQIKEEAYTEKSIDLDIQ